MKDYHHLGDGAYVRINEFGEVELITSDGTRATNIIVLEREVLEAFERWLAQQRKGR